MASEGPSKSRWGKWLLLLALNLLLGLILLWVFLRVTQDTGPVHDGRTLVVWAKDLLQHDDAKRQRAEAAIRSMGTNSVPLLARIVGRQDSPLRKPLIAARKVLPDRAWRVLYGFVRPYESDQYRRTAARALGVLGSEAAGAISALGIALKESDPVVSQDAATALAQIGKESVPVLTGALREGGSFAKACACVALAKIGADSSPAVPDLVPMLVRADSQQLQEQASYALQQIGIPAIPALIEAGRGTNEPLRDRAKTTLVKLADVSYTNLLATIDALKNPAADARATVAEALGRVGVPTKRVVLALAAALEDPDSAVRQRAAVALSGIAGRTRMVTNALPALRARLNDPDTGVRGSADQAIRNILELEKPSPGPGL